MKKPKQQPALDLEPSGFGQICNCERCGVKCRVGAIEPSKAKMLRRSTKPKGFCNNCSVTEFLANTYPPNMIIEESPHGAAILLFPQIQEQFAAIMKAGNADMNPEEINWQLVVDNWNLPLKVKASPTNPHRPGDSLMRNLGRKDLRRAHSIGGMLDQHFKETVPGYRTEEERLGHLPLDDDEVEALRMFDSGYIN